MSNASPSRRRWFRFSLKSLLIGMTLLCIVFGTWVRKSEEQRRTVKKIRSYSGMLVGYQHPDLPMNVIMDEHVNHTGVPNFLYHLLGPDYFLTVTYVWSNPFQDKKEEVLRICQELPNLKRFVTNSYHDGDQPVLLDLICELKNLEQLETQLRVDWLTEERMERLSQMKHLKKLKLMIVQKQSLDKFQKGKSVAEDLRMLALEIEKRGPITEHIDMCLIAKLKKIEDAEVDFSAIATWYSTGNCSAAVGAITSVVYRNGKEGIQEWMPRPRY